MDVRGLRCVVTGAASGIGAEVARRLTDGGAAVTALDLKAPEVPVERFVECDLTDPASIESAVDELGSGWNVLCNVAGVPGTAPADVVMKVNFLGQRHLTELFLDRLERAGSIVSVASMAGFGWPQRIEQIRDLLATDGFDEGVAWLRDNPIQGNAYNFSKEVVTVYVMSMGLALAERGLRINAVSPGPVQTPILGDFEATMGKENLDGVRDLVGRHATAADIAPSVLFLASPVSSWVNGVNLPADGGIGGAVVSGLVPAPEI
ncbi:MULTISPECIES: coniferyl-alcohol dehydrogenase [Amycolatopsis methanolica group]|uniref:3-alpha-hydroxysteroid dehydrogenase n=1 Tax=Amycolatopsis methanolica 239 TaxID=1068978 RepID=A0A076N0Q2_AMYME|nr:coniferyl-alcohol dehydrogenase [Amycolatopsis methanolica]AIJ24661.1 3-alpha-hydroxysteroid dehydrogenase [Amycolatopsis methanolica 239]